MLIRPGIQINPVEGNPAVPNGNFGQAGAHFAVEQEHAHAQVVGGMSPAVQPGDLGHVLSP